MNKTIEERADEALKNATDMKWTSAYIQGAKEQREIDEQEFKPKWISVTDRLPEEDGDYIVMKKSHTIDVATFIRDRFINTFSGREYKLIPITHWMSVSELLNK